MALNLDLTDEQATSELLYHFYAARKLEKQRASKKPDSQWNVARNAATHRLPLNSAEPQNVAAVVNASKSKPKAANVSAPEKRYIRRNKRWVLVANTTEVL